MPAKRWFTLHAARLITPDEVLSEGWITIRDGKIAAVGKGDPPPDSATEYLDGITLAPGFIDVHVHGGGGHSLTTEDAAEIESFARWAPSTGVTSFLATVVAADVEQGIHFTRAIAAASPENGANLLGVNLEGPFLNPERNGAIPRSWIVPPDEATFERLADAAAGKLRVMTFAPEIEGSPMIVEAAAKRGIALSVGHTDATYEIALRAFDNGAAHITHAFNAMRPFHHRDPGPLGAALRMPGVTVEVIADGVHLHPETVRWLVQAFGVERVALVTDGTPLVGMGDGSFRIGGASATVSGGRATLADGTIAGSVATMDQLVRNVVAWDVCDLPAALRMASAVPATVPGVSTRKGRIAPGYDADLIALDEDLRVIRSWVAGKEAPDVKRR